MQDLFTKKKKSPLADRMRPKTLHEFVGQAHLLSGKGPIKEAIAKGELHSMIFWGPPGTGKTTLAKLIAALKGYRFVSFSAVLSGVSDVRKAVAEADLLEEQMILFIDEIHRFNKAQQDAFLPYVEDGTIILIGVTTENPSFEVISPLLSRTTVYIFYPLSKEEIRTIIDRAIIDERGLRGLKPDISENVRDYIAEISCGDGRVALNILEFAVITAEEKEKRTVTLERIKEIVKELPLIYDKKGEEHYNLISAFIKSLRGSDPDAAVYWLARMLEGGEAPLFIARRMVIFAAEDVGNADPQALTLAISCKDAVHFIGRPEDYLPLSQAAIYLANAPKSNSAITTYKKALRDVKKYGALPVPLHLRNAAPSLGYGKGYKYPHDFKGGWVEEEYLPEKLKGKKYCTHLEKRKVNIGLNEFCDSLNKKIPRGNKIKLSPSSLDIFLDCPRCFWLEKNRAVKRPRGIFPSLPGGMDTVIKEYFDGYRLKNELPPEIKGKVIGELFTDITLLKKWRDWKITNLCYEDKSLAVSLSGALDDCLLKNNLHIPLDYKTRGYELRGDPRKYYQTQLDCYSLMLSASGYKTADIAYLLYYWPLKVREDGIVKFHVEPIKIETNALSAQKIVKDAALSLYSPMPEASLDCEYCNLVQTRSNEL